MIIDTIAYADVAKSIARDEYMIIFLADVAASSSPYAVR